MASHDILLVAKPGPLRDALSNLILKTSWVKHLFPVASPFLALKMLRLLKPHLVLFASNVAEEELLELVPEIKRMIPAPQCLVMVETAQQGERARAAGADASLLSGTSTKQLIATIQHALSEDDAPKPRQGQEKLS